MGFFGSIFGATVKTVLSPIAVVKDAVNITQGKDVTATKDLIDSVVSDVDDAIDSVC